ncbi:hypothetical protein [Deinococcus puniceus]|uniref:Uncharacterized protein n=1 Tax=Deinococcus puniceus TaxID=1182568 RepID=A0A172T6J7_9DEIO|nr:hypothetical protein [Deinococcus puniceus]ANE42665.1 hypothetical protein SU48_01600 [Deinococcus puniceus]
MLRPEVWTLMAPFLFALIFGFSSNEGQTGVRSSAVAVPQPQDTEIAGIMTGGEFTQTQQGKPVASINKTPVTATYTIKPGMTITGIDGVQVVSPEQWETADQQSAELKISRIDPQTLDVPLPDRYNNLVTPIYRVEAVGNYVATDSESFRIRIPIPTLNPDYVMPIRTTVAILESESEEVEESWVSEFWSAAVGASVGDSYVEFEASMIENNLFSVVELIEPYQRTKR